MIKPLKIGIIGGSITGCCAAILLSRLGHQVSVLERSEAELQDRGAGIFLPTLMVNMLHKKELVGNDYQCFLVKSRDFVVQDGTPGGKLIYPQPVGLQLNNWGLLFRHLRQRVPNECYHSSKNIQNISQKGEEVQVVVEDGTEYNFDLVIGADGYLSRTRQTIFPDVSLQYAGYVVWRGVIPEKGVYLPEEMKNSIILVANQKVGHGGLYPIPAHEKGVFSTERLINWIIYENIPRKRLTEEIMVDINGKLHRTSMPPKSLREPVVQHLRNLAKAMFPPFFADIVAHTPYPFMQTIQDMALPSYRKGRICLMGDASTVVRPHTGSGSVKGIWDANYLAVCLQEANYLEEALIRWDAERSREGNELVQIGKDIGKAIQLHPPVWEEMEEVSVAKWWNEILSGRNLYITSGE